MARMIIVEGGTKAEKRSQVNRHVFVYYYKSTPLRLDNYLPCLRIIALFEISPSEWGDCRAYFSNWTIHTFHPPMPDLLIVPFYNGW